MPVTIPETLNLKAALQIKAAKDGDQPRFKLFANSGEPMRLDGFFDPVVIDLEGVTIDREPLPVIMEHDPAKRIGHTDRVMVNAKGIFAEGRVSSSMGVAEGFVKDAKAGFPFQVSVGAEIKKGYFVEEGETVEVNGKTHKGPLIVATQTRLRELSITVLGADSKTQALVASQTGVSTMPKPLKITSDDHDLQARRQRIAAEEARVDAIRAIADRYGSQLSGEFETEDGRKTTLSALKATAVAEGWDENRFELQLLRASRNVGIPTHSYHHPVGNASNSQVLEAAIAKHVGLPQLERVYDDRTLEASDQLGITCLMDACRLAAQLSGHTLNWRDKDSVIRAAFSTTDIPDILSNVANKSAELAYETFPSAAKLIARKLTANDFKTHTGVRLTGDVVFEPLGSDGEIKHGKLDDTAYTYSVTANAKPFGLSRQAIRDDDAGALDEVPRSLGRGAALALEELFWKLVIANSGSFFSSGNGNLITGAGSALSSSGLAAAVQKFLEQTDAQGKPIGVVPERLVVPPALKATADELYVARTLNVGGGSTTTNDRVPAENVHYGKYDPAVSPWIGASGLSGGSDTRWYLFGNPNDVAAFGIAYLDGVEAPKIEPKEMAPDKLGIMWRGYFDIGACQIDPRGAVRADGV